MKSLLTTPHHINLKWTEKIKALIHSCTHDSQIYSVSGEVHHTVCNKQEGENSQIDRSFVQGRMQVLTEVCTISLQ